MGPRIRRARGSDVRAIVGVQEAVTRRRVSPEFARKVRSFVRKGNGLSLVAEADGRAVGYIIGDVKSWGFGVEESGWIEMVGVHPEFMGTGIGHALGRSLLKGFKARRVRVVYTTVRWDWGDLLAFFKSLGFERTDFINLEKRLGK